MLVSMDNFINRQLSTKALIKVFLTTNMFTSNWLKSELKALRSLIYCATGDNSMSYVYVL